MNVEVLEKVINKVPFWCRMGLHRWRAKEIFQRPGLPGKFIVKMACLRCQAEKHEAP